MRTKVYTFALTVACSCSLFGGTYTFPAGGGDLADLARWRKDYPDLTGLPGAADTVKFGSSSTFTMSSDMTVGGFDFNYQNATLDLASCGNHTLKVLDKQHAFRAHNGTIKGGLIDRNGQQFYWFQNDGYETTVTDGCVLTNASSFCVNIWGTSNGKFHLTGGSKIYAGNLTVNYGLAGTPSGGTLLEVTDGAKVFTLSTTAYSHSDLSDASASSGSNILYVRGKDSAITMAGNYIDGYFSHSNLLMVADKGSFSANALYVGFSRSGVYPHDNRLVVDDGTVNVTGGNVYCYGDGNVIAVTNGTLSVRDGAGTYDGSASTHTTIDIVDSTWKCGQFKVGKHVDLHLSGVSTVFQSSEKFFGFDGTGARDAKVCFDDGFDWLPSIGYGYYFMQTSTNCMLTVRNKAKFSGWHPTNNDYERVIFCGSSATANGNGNVIRALDGGVIYGKSVELNGPDNTFIVSNGIVRASTAIQIGASAWATNNTFVVQGDNPRLQAGGMFYLWNGSTLRMEIPPDGYVSGCVPVKAQEFILHATTCRFEVDVNQFQPKDRTELTLMSFETDLTDAQQTFLLSAELPPRYSLKIVNKRDLVLKAKGELKGLMLIFR